MKMEMTEIRQVNDALAEMVALFRVELRSYKGIVSEPNIEAGREEMEEYLSAKFPVYAALVDAQIVKVDREGNITDSFSYGDEDFHYSITDMIEFNGNIYLSAYAVPRTDNLDASSRYEIEGVLRYLFDNNIWEISSEELTPMVRDNYTALLLMCEPKTGKPQEFYSVKGSLGGKLSVSDAGNLLWDVESITSTFYAPAVNAFTIGGTSYVFRYAFDASGLLVSQEKTDEVVDFRR